MKKFGKLEKVDLTELWDGEASDFTLWLSQDENITEIGNMMEMKLEVQTQEPKVDLNQGSILCKDILTNHLVLIGNQLGKTDSTQLGQLIAWAASMKAVTIIWIARAFDKAHWESLNWLNKVTDESITFVGIEVEAYKIGDSLPALSYNFVVKPNNLVKQLKQPVTSKKLTDIELLELEYWQGLKNFMEENNSFVKLLGTPPRSWFNITHDRGKYFLSVAVDSHDNSLSISLILLGEKAKDDFDRLYEIAYANSLVEVNKDLVWYKLQANIRSAITLKTYADFTGKSDWPNQFAWFKENLERFDKYFRPKIKQLAP